MQRGEDKYFTGSEIGVSHMLEKEPVRGRVESELCILWIHCKQHQLTIHQLGGHRDGSGHLELKECTVSETTSPSIPRYLYLKHRLSTLAPDPQSLAMEGDPESFA